MPVEVLSTREGYDRWAAVYDSDGNPLIALEEPWMDRLVGDVKKLKLLDVGCGTGRHAVRFAGAGAAVDAIDFSEAMLKKAKEKISSNKVEFKQVDITQPWPLNSKAFDLVSFSLVLEHIANLAPIFSEAVKVLKKGGYLYLGELHPFKQYSGSKAKFDTASGTQVLECYTHHVADFIKAAKANDLSVVDLDEHFDDGDSNSIPRILTILFQKS